MKVAINQPYFAPYSGYFSLINSADTFVFYDCVQFIRRGRIHRSQLHQSLKLSDGWLTLPLEKAPQTIKIADVRMKPWKEVMFSPPEKNLLQLLNEDFDCSTFETSTSSLSDFLLIHLQQACARLGITTPIIRSSCLELSDSTGQDRIIEICRKLKATDYLNLPGGRDLYSGEDFQKQGIDLHFLDTSPCSRSGYLQAQAEQEWDRFYGESRADLISQAS